MGKILFICLLTQLLLVGQLRVNGNAVENIFNRVQKTWMERWRVIRDQQIKPRLFAEMQLTAKPTFVEVCVIFFYI